ncbi:unnamed protein product [Candidula unifasciata]|uniref:Calcineurin-like phosphoesterase domain-containing protein n=1 Tax=Candidula unifasciata TaxID=100452 RepID=A0A8S3ZSP3_9EUPU|nr:unnamed protein product [Candidula unifasciata]
MICFLTLLSVVVKVTQNFKISFSSDKRMAFSLWHKLIFALVIIAAVIIGQLIVNRTCSFQVAAVVFRIQMIGLIQTGMFLLSRLIIWRTFVPLVRQLSPQCSTSAIHQNDSEFSRSQLRKVKNSDLNLSAMNKDEADHVSVTIGKAVLFIYLCMCHVSYLTNLFLIHTDPHWISMLTYASFGSYIQLLTGLGMFKLLSLGICACQKLRSSSNPWVLSYRHITALALVYAIAASTVGLYTASQPPAVKHVTVKLKDLPSRLDGLSIVQLSDIHLGPTVGKSKLTKIVEIVNTEKPDIVVVTGDLVDSSVEHLRGAAEPLKDIHSLYGKFFVTGNHEYYTGDVDNWFVYLRSLGFTILHNSNVRIPSADGHSHICLAGTDDIQADRTRYDGHKFDLDKAVSSCSSDKPVILLAHQPHAAKMALDSKYRIDLVLSGHTHGGQMFPMIIGAYFLNPFYVGLYQYGNRGSQVYVSPGTQYWGIPMRIATSMEITRITLHKAI